MQNANLTDPREPHLQLEIDVRLEAAGASVGFAWGLARDVEDSRRRSDRTRHRRSGLNRCWWPSAMRTSTKLQVRLARVRQVGVLHVES